MKRDWFSRYCAGEHEQVWRELRQLGAGVRVPDIRAEAQVVCDTMAIRARQNVEAIIEDLRADGFRFHANNDDQTPMAPHIPPSPNAADLVMWLEQSFGPLPLTLVSWIKHIGDVWLVGTHPDWQESVEADPLVVQAEGLHDPDSPIRDYFTGEWNAWQEDADDPKRPPFILSLAPDYLHKANMSGGGPYGMLLPDDCADGIFRAELGSPFVEYLNWVFRRAGFPRATGNSAKEWEITHKRGAKLLRL